MKKLRLLFYLVILSPLFLAGQDIHHIIIPFDSLIDQIEKQSGDSRILTMLLLSEAYQTVSLEKSIETGEAALLEASQRDKPELSAKIYRSLANSARQSGDFQLSNEFYSKANEIYHQLGNELQQAYISNNMAYNLLEQAESEVAESEFLAALQIAEKHQDDTLVMLISLNLGKAYYQRGAFSEAYDWLYRALLIADQQHNDFYWATAQQSIAMIHWQWDENDKALTMLFEVAKVFENHNNNEHLSKVYNNIGLVYLYDKNQPDSALIYFNQALQIRYNNGWYQAAADVMINIAIAQTDQGNYADALNLLIQSQQIFEQAQAMEAMIRILHQQGKIYHLTKEYPTSNELLHNSLRMAQDAALDHYIPIITELMLKNYELMNDFTGFLSIYKLYTAHYDSIYSQLIAMHSSEIDWKSENQTLLRHLEAQKNQTILLEKKIQSLRYYLGAIAAFVVVFMLSWWIYKISYNTSSSDKGYIRRLLVNLKK